MGQILATLKAGPAAFATSILDRVKRWVVMGAWAAADPRHP